VIEKCHIDLKLREKIIISYEEGISDFGVIDGDYLLCFRAGGGKLYFCQLATVKVALDWSKASGTSLGTPIAVPAGMIASNNSLNLQVGDRLTLRDLVYSVSMANDEVGALVIADFVGRHLLSHRGVAGDPITTFVQEMQSLATNLKMTDTTFVNPYGTSAAGGA